MNKTHEDLKELLDTVPGVKEYLNSEEIQNLKRQLMKKYAKEACDKNDKAMDKLSKE